MITQKCKNCKRCSIEKQIDEKVVKLIVYNDDYDNNKIEIWKIQKEFGLTHNGAMKKWRSMRWKR